MADKNVVYRGAEAVLYKKDGVLVKDRIRKGYRIQQLDRKIRKQRTRHEDSLMERARRAGVDVPRIFSSSDTSIEMEFIEGRKVKDAFNGAGNRERGRISGLIGQALGRLHEANIVHGDFTTSNMILKGGKLYVIDMGLGKYSEKVEDKSVDLYLLHEALKA
ncbi:MAG: Kae1-associated kinase Bud32, partial [Candidatus Aenigmatarchaeota archaeon]